jgi:hypothetical protein
VRARNVKLTAVPVLAVAFASVLAIAVSGSDASAEGRDAGPPGPPVDAGPAPEAGFIITKTPPDPAAMSERQQWVFDLRWDRGDIYLLEVHKIDMGEPHLTPRVMGRFALELFEGPTLIERVRFDFPMLGPPPAPDAGKTPARFEPKLRTRIGVLFPATKRGTRLELWDRATNVRMPLAWPPVEGTARSDAGARP